MDWWKEIEERIARWEEIDERGERGARRLMRDECEGSKAGGERGARGVRREESEVGGD